MLIVVSLSVTNQLKREKNSRSDWKWHLKAVASTCHPMLGSLQIIPNNGKKELIPQFKCNQSYRSCRTKSNLTFSRNFNDRWQSSRHTQLTSKRNHGSPRRLVDPLAWLLSPFHKHLLPDARPVALVIEGAAQPVSHLDLLGDRGVVLRGVEGRVREHLTRVALRGAIKD